MLMVTSRSDLGRPEAVLRLTLLKTIVSNPAGGDGATLILAMPLPIPWSPELSAGAVSPVMRVSLMIITPW